MRKPEVVLNAGAELGEGPVWDNSTQTLIWVDLLRGVVHRSDLVRGVDEVIDVGRPVGAVAPRAGGGLVIATAAGFESLDPATGSVTTLAAVEQDQAETRMNDGKCDPRGRFWAGTMAEDATPGKGALYRLDPDGSVQLVIDQVTISNGLAWDEARNTMYFIDTGRASIDAFDYDPESGGIGRRRCLVEIPREKGLPDGMAIDNEGGLWVALCFGWCVNRYTPQGELDDVIAFPVSEVTSCAFGGSDLGDLYVTTGSLGLQPAELRAQPGAGGVFRLRPGVAGPLPPPFAG